MELNLPILKQLTDCKNLLIAGMGGGFDIFCGLPIYFELKKRGIACKLTKMVPWCTGEAGAESAKARLLDEHGVVA